MQSQSPGMISLKIGEVMYKSKSLNNMVHKNQVLNHIDTFLRDAEIRGYWEGLKKSELKHYERIDIACKHFHISDSTLKVIISRKNKKP